jgi:hypothetical protein
MKYLLVLFSLFACDPVFALRPANIVMLNAVTNSGTQYSTAIDAQQIVSGSIQASFSSSGAGGTLVLQCSNDNPVGLYVGSSVPVPTHWSTCANGSNMATATVTSGALTLISMQWLNSRWLRVGWTESAGTGTVTVTGQFQAQ